MSNERNERESYIRPPTPGYIYTPRRAYKPYNRMQKRAAEVVAEWTESDHAPQSGSGACKRAAGAAAHAPLGLDPGRGLAPWPGGPS